MDKNDKFEKRRKFLAEKFKKNGFEDFSDHEMLEYLLSFLFKQQDTGEMASEILSEGRTLQHVLSEEINLLECIKKLTPNTAAFLEALGKFARECIRRSAIKKVFDISTRKAHEYVVNMFEDFRFERVYAILLDAKDRLIGSAKVCDGSIIEAEKRIGDILRRLWRLKPSKVIFAYNNPGGSLELSPAQAQAVFFIRGSMLFTTMSLGECVLVSDDACISVLEYVLKNSDILENEESVEFEPNFSIT